MKIMEKIYDIVIYMLNRLFIKKIRYECNSETLRCSEDYRNINYKYYIFGKNTPKCCINNLKKLMADVILILKRENKDYFIIWGTLLGAVRNKGFIPWDTDIDIGILENDCQEVLFLFKELEKKYYIDISKIETDKIIRIYLSKKNNLHIDIEIWKELKEKLYFSEFGEEYIYDKNIFFPLKIFYFEGMEVFGPNCEEIFLKNYYGDNFREIGYKKYAIFNRKVKL